MTPDYAAKEPARTEVDALPGATLLEFGAPWCGICRGIQPALANAMKAHPGLRHLKIEDGPGRPLGRSYNIKLWPTLILLRDGLERERLIRPRDLASISQALQRLTAATV
ncbi:thioredoxin family protein [Aquincola sp. S2]|uniref:Thioredoxin family protein n=1 Tax=Pseudaquabacterium terrae TaxID=2732868 RepID=A0ABX2EHY4_9BURK|nr:thioredoxin family protein [Aquabacterium terrae]NRF68234.1 thioredoxin family protein [Aquabacterium terrae]